MFCDFGIFKLSYALISCVCYTQPGFILRSDVMYARSIFLAVLALFVLIGCDGQAPATPSPTPVATAVPTAIPYTPTPVALTPEPEVLASPTARTIKASLEIPVGREPNGLDIDNGILWVANSADNNVQRIDVKTGEVVATIKTGLYPDNVHIDKDNIYVTSSNGEIWKIDPTTNTAAALAIDLGLNMSGFTVSPGALWVCHFNENTVTRIDPATGTVVATIPVGEAPANIRFGQGSIWVPNHHGKSVMRIDPETNKVVATIKTEQNEPSGVAFVGDSVWIAQPSVVLRLDPTTNEVIAQLPMTDLCSYMAPGTDGLWVSDGTNDPSSIMKIDLATNRIVTILKVSPPLCVGFSDGYMWGTDFDNSKVLRFDEQP
jgi:virginiamycin B lyase